jgi:hypothetical protein
VATQQIKLLVLKLQNVGDSDAEKIESLKKKLAQEIQAKEDIEL